MYIQIFKLVSTAQETMPKLRGTAMSLASINMLVGGAIGTSVNGKIINASSIKKGYQEFSVPLKTI
jgi:hypothetical protein